MENKLNVLFVLNSRYSVLEGGVQRSTINLFNYLNDKNINSYAIFNSNYSNENPKNLIIDYIESPDLLKKYILKYEVNIVILPGGPWYSLIAKKAIDGIDCKIITAYHLSPGHDQKILKGKLTDKIKNKPSLKIYLYNRFLLMFFFFYKFYCYKKSLKLMKNGFLASDKFVLLSENLFKPFTEYYKLFDKKLIAIPNALSFDCFANSDQIENKKNIVLIVSRLYETEKRLILALDSWKVVFQENIDWELHIVGDGVDKSFYEEYVEKKNIKNVTFLGKKNPFENYLEASIFLMTSVSEGWPMTLMEATQLACVPIVLDTFPTLNQIIKNDENGIVIPENQKENLSNKINFLINDRKKRIEMAKNGVEFSKSYTMDNIGKQWISFLNSL